LDTVLNGTSVIGSIVGTRADLAVVFGLHAARANPVSYQTRPLAKVNECIEEVLHGKASALGVMMVRIMIPLNRACPCLGRFG
jgi:alcohol dehydrogenase, propanol-preferring